MKEGEKLEVELVRITDEGLGIGFTSDGATIIVENCSEDDRVVKVEIKEVLEESVIAKKLSRTKAEPKPHKDEYIENPYEVDEEDIEDEE